MRKLYLLAGIFTIFAYNAEAQYYESRQPYYRETLRYVQQQPKEQVRYIQTEEPQYVETEYYEREAPRYRRVSNTEEQRYREKVAYREYEEPNKIRPYIGLDLATTSWKFADDEDKDYAKNNATAFSGVVGARINKNFGIEAYYQQSSDAKKSYKPDGEGEDSIADAILKNFGQGKTSLKYKSYGIDLIGYMPVSREFELLAALGVGSYDFNATNTITLVMPDGTNMGYSKDSPDFDSLGIRIGIGAQYNINEHFALRAMARYIKLNDDDYVKNLTEFSLGLRYTF